MPYEIPLDRAPKEKKKIVMDCKQSCNGILPSNYDNAYCRETLSDSLFNAFHTFYLENRGLYLILFFNANGQVLSSIGDREIYKEITKRGIIPGAGWSDNCNNLFIASIRGNQALIHLGPQENCSLFSPFSLISIPLHYGGKISGGVGILGKSEIYMENLYPKVKEFVVEMEKDLSFFSAKDVLTGDGSLEKVLASMVHEIKNPLMLIRGNAQLGKMLASAKEKDRKFNKIITEVDSLINMVDSMVVMYKKNHVEFQDNDIHVLLQEVIGVVEAEMNLKDLVLEKKFLAKKSCFSFHYNLIRQAFVNLLGNCIQFLDKGGALSITTDNPSEDTICIRVRDTGPGIEEQELSRVFLPFYSTREEGTGLGLAIVKKIIVHSHGGLINIESKVGVGTLFIIQFPLVRRIK